MYNVLYPQQYWFKPLIGAFVSNLMSSLIDPLWVTVACYRHYLASCLLVCLTICVCININSIKKGFFCSRMLLGFSVFSHALSAYCPMFDYRLGVRSLVVNPWPCWDLVKLITETKPWSIQGCLCVGNFFDAKHTSLWGKKHLRYWRVSH